jgi:hypothetical protein
VNTPRASRQADGRQAPRYWSKGAVAVAMLAVIALFFLIREHWTHLFGTWVYLLLLLCPLLHLYGHGEHGPHHDPESKG